MIEVTSKKPRRFFYHYYKQKDRMSVHFMGACHVVDRVVCDVRDETKRNKRQPRVVQQGFARSLIIKNGVATIA